MGVHSAEIYNNLGLCCIYSQQYDITLACFRRALDLAIEPSIKAEVWYNLSHVAIVSYPNSYFMVRSYDLLPWLSWVQTLHLRSVDTRSGMISN